MGAHDICTNLEQNSEDTNRRLMEDVNSRNSPADIAVIGFSLKYPQTADSPDGFWSMLQEKKCAMTKWPKDRINLEAFYHRDEEGSQNVSLNSTHPSYQLMVVPALRTRGAFCKGRSRSFRRTILRYLCNGS